MRETRQVLNKAPVMSQELSAAGRRGPPGQLFPKEGQMAPSSHRPSPVRSPSHVPPTLRTSPGTQASLEQEKLVSPATVTSPRWSDVQSTEPFQGMATGNAEMEQWGQDVRKGLALSSGLRLAVPSLFVPNLRRHPTPSRATSHD